STSADPCHAASSFLGVSNPQGILQWDDARMNVPQAWSRTHGDRSVRVAVLDTGVERSHRELNANFGTAQSFIPCDTLTRDFGAETVKRFGLRDCSTGDNEGHGTWVASRIAGALNGFASNGVAPRVQISSYKVLAAGFGGMPDWILSGLVAACRDRVDLVNMSITGYLDPNDAVDAQTYLLFEDVVQWCRSRGVTIFAAAGNEHVRVDSTTLTVGGRTLAGVGRVSSGAEGVATAFPGQTSLDDSDLRGALEAPAGVPGVISKDPIQSSLFNFACFKVEGNGFGWLQGTSMATPNAVGVAALAISARPSLRDDPDALAARLLSTAQRGVVNYTGPSDAAN